MIIIKCTNVDFYDVDTYILKFQFTLNTSW